MRLLNELFGDVLIPPTVANELARGSSKWSPIDVTQFQFVRVQAPNLSPPVELPANALDPGETEAIQLALELGADLLIIDDRQGRSFAGNLGLEYIGTLGVLIRAKKRGLVPAIEPLLPELQSQIDFFLSAELCRQILLDAGELPS